MRLICVLFLVIITNNIVVLSKECSIKKLNTKLICYYSRIDLKQISSCKCSHIVLPLNTNSEQISELRDVFKKQVKLLITINEFNQDVVELIESHQLDGIELNLKKLNSREDIGDFLSTIRQKFSDLFTLVTVPAKPEILAKFYDFKTLTKYVDGYVLQTGFLGMSKNVTFHPSRLSGLWDMQNTDSVVDLVSGLGAPLSKLIITAPVQGFRFKLQNSKYTAPGSPALQVQTITRNELCKLMKNGRNWTLERDQDQAGPFIFNNDEWIAFDDPTSIDIKAKYARIRGLAGLALADLSQDGDAICDDNTLLDAAYDGLNRQARAPRGAVLHSLEREIRQIPHHLDTVQVSPYRISRVIDVEGNIHSIRQDTRTEFACSRQGYFVHPRSCNRFYRCVKFDQLVDDFNVFEFDCPAGLVFDERVEVCVWPGNLEHGSACAGSSEIAPVPQGRFVCPSEPGYYADPENCRWFFACLDHGKSSMTAYEFRCPFGLVFDETRLLCEWAWLVPRCANGYAKTSSIVYGYGTPGVVSLEHYDGLGVLPVTQLGGLSGPIQEPIAQIYTNVGSGGIIANSGLNGYNLISTNAGFGGLSANAALSLQNAGLLKTGQYNTLGLHGSNYKALGEADQYITSGGIGGAYQGTNLDNSGKLSGSVILTAGQQNAHLINSLAHDTSAQIENNAGFGAKSYQNIEQYHQHSNNDALLDQNNIKLANGIAGNINIVSGGYSAVGTFDSGVEISNNGVGSSTIAHVTPSPISVTTLPSVPTVTTVPIPSISTIKSFQSYNGGVVANLPQLQYRVDGHSGYTTDQQSLNVANISANYVNLISSTPASVLHEEIPLKTTGSYSYENQALLSTLGGTSLKTGNNEAKSLTFIHTQPAVSVSTFNKYNTNGINAETTQNLYGEAKLLQPAVSVSSFNGYHYGQRFEEKPILKVQPTVSTIFVEDKPSVQPVVKQPVVSVPTLQGYNYEKPTVLYEEKPLVNVQSTVQPAVSFSTFQSYNDQKAAVLSQQKTLEGVQSLGVTVEQPVAKIQPAVSFSTYESYSTPSVRYEQKPIVKVLPTVQTVPQPAVSFTSFQNYNDKQASAISQGAAFEKVASLGTVVEQPSIVKIQPAVPAVVQPAVSYTTFQSYNDKQSSAISQGATFEKVASAGTIIEQQPSIVKVQPTVPTVVQPAISYATFQSYGNNKASTAYEDKSYEKVSTLGTIVEQQPSIINVQPTVQAAVQPAVSFSTYQSYNDKQASAISQEASLEKVATYGTRIEQQPAVFEGYNYPKPAIAFEEKPLIKAQPTVQTVVQPAVSFTTFQSYGNNKASATYDDKSFEKVNTVGTLVEQEQPVHTVVQPAVSYTTFQSYDNNKATYEDKSFGKVSTLGTVVEQAQPVQTVVQPAVSYTTFQSYDNNKASATYEDKSFGKVSTLGTVVEQQQPIQTVVQPAVSFTKFQSYNTQNLAENKNIAKSESLSTLIEQQPVVSTFQGYHYEKPAIRFEERPLIKVQPTVQIPVQPVSHYETYSYSKPSVQLEQRPLVKIESAKVIQPTVPPQPAVSFATFQSYNNQKSIVAGTAQPTVSKQGYYYPKPSVVFEETPIKTVPVPTAVKGYSYPKPSVVFEEKPQVYVSTTPVPIISSTPAIVSSYTPIQKTVIQPSTYNFKKIIEDYSYTKQQTPTVISYGTTTTAKPAVVSSYSYTAPIQYNYQQSSGYVYDKPQINFEEVPLPVTEVPFVKKTAYVTGLDQSYEQRKGKFDEQAVLVENYQVPSTPRTIVDYNYVQSTVKPSFETTFLTAAKVPVTPKQFYYYDSRLSTPRSQIKYATTALPTVPILTSTTTSRPIVKYSFSSLDEVPPTPEYRPIKITTPLPELSREYLPVKIASTTAVPSYDEVFITTKRPAKVVKIVRPTTIVKQNDFNPLLTAKLGAQCTCVSNTLRLRKKPVKIIVQEIDDDDDDGYVVDDRVFVENYQKTVDIAPEIGVSTIKSNVGDKEIAKAVRTGLKLVKETVKDGVSEALDHRAFDRYGPGGVRSRDERLQGTIDCQRPGLFRHPTECNKFYSCRWDCTKKRYTLHVFNCPVHLTFDNHLGACNWPSQGPACLENTLLTSD